MGRIRPPENRFNLCALTMKGKSHDFLRDRVVNRGGRTSIYFQGYLRRFKTTT